MRKLYLNILAFMLAQGSLAQTLATGPLTGAHSTAFYSQTGITLTSGFVGQPGFRAYIVPFSCTPLAMAPSADRNYIVTYAPRSPFTDAGQLPNQTVCDVNAVVRYFDGLGRPMQTVQVKGNSDATKDIVTPIEYDEFGREARKYLPYASTGSDGSCRIDAFTAQPSFYNSPPAGVVQTPFPFSETVFEPSPLNRVLEQGAPGDAWQPTGTPNTSDAGHTVKIEYGANADNEVKLWTVTANGATGTTDYSANELYKTISKDENWKSADGKAGTTEEFRDKEGRTVLKRIWEDNCYALSTYYVYDDFGNLRYVVPPALNDKHSGKIDLTAFTDKTQTLITSSTATATTGGTG